ncbi:hypothetical protein PIB30_052554 [Stylosanthes scabra]|uniref:Uncharacterized protein n=1 Tax=Stylosanthes scabra TaxID=79078 RepID=A0ABU6ULP2_9FABA|nr:hypothetical protein [Stylosanthes scabra]
MSAIVNDMYIESFNSDIINGAFTTSPYHLNLLHQTKSTQDNNIYISLSLYEM